MERNLHVTRVYSVVQTITLMFLRWRGISERRSDGMLGIVRMGMLMTAIATKTNKDHRDGDRDSSLCGRTPVPVILIYFSLLIGGTWNLITVLLSPLAMRKSPYLIISMPISTSAEVICASVTNIAKNFTPIGGVIFIM